MSVALFVVDKLLRLTMKRRFRRDPRPVVLREIMERGARNPAPVPKSVSISQIEMGGVRVEKLARRDDDASRAVLYVHGGGFVAGSPRTHRAITGRLAARVAPVFAVDYRLAPEHPFPAGLDDVAAVYHAILEGGASHIAVGGDSAGGNLTLALVHFIREKKWKMPNVIFAISPATDLAAAFPSRKENVEHDAMFVTELFDTVRPAYAPNEDPENPLLSPLRGDLHGFPPTLIQCAEREMLRDDSIRFAAKLRDAGVETKLDVWPGVFHAWPFAAQIVPESRRAIDDIIAFITPFIVS